MANARSLNFLAGVAVLGACQRLRPHASRTARKPWKKQGGLPLLSEGRPPHLHEIVVRAAIGWARRHTAWEGDGRDPKVLTQRRNSPEGRFIWLRRRFSVRGG
jgi:hypothetical protein